MKVLVLCDQGNNRSVTLAHHLKYWGHDVLPAGVKTNSAETLMLLFEWADRIIITEDIQEDAVSDRFADKLQLWDIGPDRFKRPFNPELLEIVRELMDEHKAEYKQ